MLRFFFVFIFCLLLIKSGQTQNFYASYLSKDKIKIISENFTNTKNWGENLSGDFVYKTQDSGLYMENKSNLAQIISAEYDINENKNYEIEVWIKQLSGKKTIANALLWGKNNYSDFGFYIATIQNFKIAKYDSVCNNLVDFCYNEEIKVKDYNKLTIRKVNKVMYFFVNENFVCNLPVEPFFGKKIGFMVGEKNKIHVKNLNIYYLPEKINPYYIYRESEIKETDTLARKYTWKNKKKKTVLINEPFINNVNNWGEYATDSLVWKIDSGNYLITNRSSLFYNSLQYFEFDTKKNFEIETSIKIKVLNNRLENCFMWGASDNSSYRFGINSFGEFVLYNAKESGSELFTEFVYSDIINIRDYNKLTIRKCDNTYYFFINESLVLIAPYQDFYGFNFGYLIAKQSAVQIDYLKIVHIE